MSDSVKKYFEDNPSVGHFGNNANEITKNKLKEMMKKEKILTDELIEKKMLEMEFSLEVDSDEARKFVLNHYNITLEGSWNNADFMIYPETTADGYEVFIATNSDNNINISEHVFYYESRLGEALSQAIEDYYDGNIYLDFDVNESWVEETFSEMYQHLYEEQEQELTNELESEGYEY